MNSLVALAGAALAIGVTTAAAVVVLDESSPPMLVVDAVTQSPPVLECGPDNVILISYTETADDFVQVAECRIPFPDGTLTPTSTPTETPTP